jgi:hypothetical protein
VVDLRPVSAVAHGSAGIALPCHRRRHPNALAQRRVGVDGFADVHSLGAHLNVHVDEVNV